MDICSFRATREDKSSQLTTNLPSLTWELGSLIHVTWTQWVCAHHLGSSEAEQKGHAQQREKGIFLREQMINLRVKANLALRTLHGALESSD